MSARKKVLLLGGLALGVFLLAVGCSLLVKEDSAAGAEWYIKLRIQALAARGITVDELDVTGMAITVLGPGEEVLQSIDWKVSDGSQEYLVALPQPGEYGLEVTHFGEGEGVPVQAKESAAFEIRVMKITVIDIVPGGIGLVWVASGQKQDGTITGRLTGAMDFNGLDGAFLVLPAGAAISPDTILGSGMLLITGGSAEGIVKESLDALDPIVFTGGGLYDLYAYIDLGGDDFPTKGDYWAGPMVVQVDGDMFVDFTFPGDFQELAEGFPFTWQLYGTWANEIYNDLGGPAAKIIILESGVVQLFANVLSSDPFETASFEITNDWTDEQSHWFEAIAYGSAYMLCRIYEGGNTLEVVTSEVIYYRQ